MHAELPSLTVSAMTSAGLGVVNYEWDATYPRGTGVTVMVIDSQIDYSLPLMRDLDISYPLPTLPCGGPISPFTDCIDHGSVVAGVMAGRDGGFIFGPAFDSSIESINLENLLPFLTGLSVHTELTSLSQAFDQSNAFVVSNSWGLDDVFTVSISDERALDLCSGLFFDLYCRPGHFEFYGPLMESFEEIYDAQKSWLKDRGWLGVWAIGNDGFNGETGEILGVNGRYFSVSEAMDTELFEYDGLTRFLSEHLYGRGEFVNSDPPAGQEPLDGYVLAVAAVHPYEVGTAAALSISQGFPAVTLTLADIVAVRGTLALTTSVTIREIGIAYYSNACGAAMDHCLVAPGWTGFSYYFGPFESPYSPGVHPSSELGTSFAVPLVSAAAALLKSSWPHLDPPGVSTILLTTATDLGVRGVDREYGHGLLNISAALEPVGEVSTRSGIGLAEARLAAGPALDHAIAASGATFGMEDAMGRPYLYRLSDRTETATTDHSGMDGLTRAAMSLADSGMAERMGLANDRYDPMRHGARVSSRLGGWTHGAGIEHCHPSCAFGFEGNATFLVPSAAVAWAQSQSRGLWGGAFGLAVEAGLDDAGEALTYRKAGLFHTLHTHDAMLRLEAGSMSEHDTYMGSGFGSAFGVTDGEGLYATARLGVRLDADLGLGATYTRGSMGTSPLPGSLVAVAEDVGYDGFSLAIGGDGWELYHAAPVAATSGRLRIDSVGGYMGDGGSWSVMDTADGVALQGEVSHANWRFREDREWVDLGGGARERMTGLLMGRRLGAGTFSFGLEHVTNSPSLWHKGDEGRLALSYELDL